MDPDDCIEELVSLLHQQRALVLVPFDSLFDVRGRISEVVQFGNALGRMSRGTELLQKWHPRMECVGCG
jgi:hypothetical protein